jgi:hypothetical protein
MTSRLSFALLAPAGAGKNGSASLDTRIARTDHRSQITDDKPDRSVSIHRHGSSNEAADSLKGNQHMPKRTLVVMALLPMFAMAALAQTTATPCSQRKAHLLYPGDGATNVGAATTTGPKVLFVWTAVKNAASYDIYIGLNGATPSARDHVTDAEFSILSVAAGKAEWYVQTNYDGNCPSTTSDHAQFTVAAQCLPPTKTVAAVVRTVTTGEQYHVRWRPEISSTHYQLQESLNADFTGAPPPYEVDGSQLQIQHDVTAPTAYYYRVRAIAACNEAVGPYSTVVRTVILPKPAQAVTKPQLTTQAISKRALVHQVFIPNKNGANCFTVTTDKPWITVMPSSGPLPANGTFVTVTIDPTQIDAGAHTAPLTITTNTCSSSNGIASDAAAAVSTVPVSVNLVTPVSTNGQPGPAPSTLILPSVSHADGFNSQWQSDIRLANPSTQPQQYLLTFTPTGTDVSTTEVHSTTIEVDPGATTAINDIINTWYGFGALSDGLNGTLQITPVDSNGNPLNISPRAVAVASSRTYDVTANGTLGQFIPAIPFAQFIGGASKLSLQQIAQSNAFRTNLGLAEGAGQPVSLLLNVFAPDGSKVSSNIPTTLAAGQQIQLNSFLAAHGITNFADGRIEVSVASGSGKVAAYASVVDNGTQDPLAVNGVDPTKVSANRFTLPGVADLNNATLHWRTDMRIYNAGATTQTATVTFYPSTPSNQQIVPISKTVSVPPGQVVLEDGILQNLFGVNNTGGSVQVTTPSSSSLIITGRTYNQDVTGTYGQFVPAVTATDAVGLSDTTPLQILQVEQSDAYRTNLGLAEVTGNPATVEITAIVPDSKVTPVLPVTLRPNEFIQLGSIMAALGFPTAYNVRLSIRVTSGTGKVTAYASVVDNVSSAPTYVPAQ